MLALSVFLLWIAGFIGRRRRPNAQSPGLVALAPEQEWTIAGEELTVRGRSMGRVLLAGTAVQLDRGYFDCQPFQLGQMVAVTVAGRKVPAVQVIRAVPGSTLAVKKIAGVGYFSSIAKW